MKKLLLSLLLVSALGAAAQDDSTSAPIQPAAKGVVYGQAPSPDGDAVTPATLQQRAAAGVFEGKITGRVTEVCKAMGCWFKVDAGNGQTVMIKTKDHGYFLPQDLIGKTVLVEGTASVKEVSEEKRRHLAKDAGKSEEEIKKIKGSARELQFIASGVLVAD